MKPRYFQVSFGTSKGPPMGERSKGGGEKLMRDLEKWKTSVFECST